MSSDQTFSTQDIRSGAVEYQRTKDQKSKWAFGQAWGPGRREDDGAPARPARPSTEPTGYRRDGYSVASFKHQARRSRKAESHFEPYVSGDSSAEEDVVEASAAPEPDAEITYSFDATRGPGQGSQVLGHALAKAIERYEVGVTDKLIKDEYEVLNTDGEPVAGASRGKGKAPAAVEEDEYEFV